jgi:serine phosphatase RsbU (regulator of sigma subunit)/anti-sigma regulatory factor (Ser/Thr protein kinase)
MLKSETVTQVTRIEIAAEAAGMAVARDKFVTYLEGLALEPEEVSGWKLVFSELVNNATLHGSKGILDARVGISWWTESNCIWLEIRDSGSGPDEARLRKPELPEDKLQESGRGLYIAHSFLTKMEGYRGSDGFVLRCFKQYPFLNNALPETQELELVLDELSDCYENLTLFYRLADSLVEGVIFDRFVSTAVSVFSEAGGYQVVHIEKYPECSIPEMVKLSEAGILNFFGSAESYLWKEIESGNYYVWDSGKTRFPFQRSRKGSQKGCCIPIKNRKRMAGLIAITPRKEAGDILARDIRNLKSLVEVIEISLSRSIMDREQQDKQRVSHELMIAASMHKELLSLGALDPYIPGYEVLLRSIPALEVAGDFCEARPGVDGSYVFCMIDVMGKGLTAAILAGIFRSHFIRYSMSGDSPSVFLDQLNKSLEIQLSGRAIFITAVVCRFHPLTGLIEYAGAGHPPCLLIAGNEPIKEYKSSGPPIGLFSDAQYRNDHVQLMPGNRFVLLTDGLYEWSSGYGVFGWEALLNWFSMERNSPGERIWGDLIDNIREAQSVYGKRQEDDETLLIITRKENEESIGS